MKKVVRSVQTGAVSGKPMKSETLIYRWHAMVRVHVNSHTIARNARHGTNDPPIAIRRGSKPAEYAHEVELVGKARVVYRPNKPLSCGARMWIEADDAIGKAGPAAQDLTLGISLTVL
jgi:hypothetical protein